MALERKFISSAMIWSISPSSISSEAMKSVKPSAPTTRRHASASASATRRRRPGRKGERILAGSFRACSV
jgi:hypothetical protein